MLSSAPWNKWNTEHFLFKETVLCLVFIILLSEDMPWPLQLSLWEISSFFNMCSPLWISNHWHLAFFPFNEYYIFIWWENVSDVQLPCISLKITFFSFLKCCWCFLLKWLKEPRRQSSWLWQQEFLLLAKSLLPSTKAAGFLIEANLLLYVSVLRKFLWDLSPAAF